MNIKDTTTPIKMKTNVGSHRINKEGEVPGLKKKVWFDKESMANIFSFARFK